MIQLNLGIGKGDVKVIDFKCFNDMVDYLENVIFENVNGVFVVTGNGVESDIFISDNTFNILVALNSDIWSELTRNTNSVLHVQQYETFEDAYKVALDMREGHEWCYNSQVKTK